MLNWVLQCALCYLGIGQGSCWEAVRALVCYKVAAGRGIFQDCNISCWVHLMTPVGYSVTALNPKECSPFFLEGSDRSNGLIFSSTAELDSSTSMQTIGLWSHVCSMLSNDFWFLVRKWCCKLLNFLYRMTSKIHTPCKLHGHVAQSVFM